jgi:hypothetical protein
VGNGSDVEISSQKEQRACSNPSVQHTSSHEAELSEPWGVTGEAASAALYDGEMAGCFGVGAAGSMRKHRT